MVFPTFFSLSLNLAIRNAWSEPQSAPGLIFANCRELLHLQLQKYNQSDFGVDHLVMSMCRVISCVVGRECLLWPVRSLGKTVSLCPASFYIQGQTCLLLQVSLDFLLLHSSPLWWKRHLFLVLVLDLIGLFRTIQLQVFRHLWLGHRLGLPCDIEGLPWKQRSFCCFQDCTQVLHFGLFYWLWRLLHFF